MSKPGMESGNGAGPLVAGAAVNEIVFRVENALLSGNTPAARQHAAELPGLVGALAQTEVHSLQKQKANDKPPSTDAIDAALPGVSGLIAGLGANPQFANEIVGAVAAAGSNIDRHSADYLLGMALSALVAHNKVADARRLAFGDENRMTIDTSRGLRWSYSVAKTLLAANQPGVALQKAEPLENAFPGAVAVIVHLQGLILRQMGKKPAAARAFLRCVEANPYFVPPITALHFLTWGGVAVQESLPVVERVVNAGPSHTKLHTLLADLYAMAGQVERARPIYRAAAKTRILEARPALAELQWPEQSPSKPDFIIIGAPKCGTTSAFNYLHGHPKVLSPSTKEITFFNDDRRYALGTDWYLSQFPSLAGSNGYISGEATPGYFFSDIARQRIKEDFPDTRLILFLRDPAARAISAYYQQVKMGRQNQPIREFFHNHLARQAAGTPDGDSESVLGKGIYHLLVRPWLESFGPQGLLIIKAEDFFTQPRVVMREIFAYLGIEDVKHARYPVSNKGLYPQAPEDLIKELSDYFRPHNEVFYRLAGRDFNW